MTHSLPRVTIATLYYKSSSKVRDIPTIISSIKEVVNYYARDRSDQERACETSNRGPAIEVRRTVERISGRMSGSERQVNRTEVHFGYISGLKGEELHGLGRMLYIKSSHTLGAAP